jgi:hypothetical protein
LNPVQTNRPTAVAIDTRISIAEAEALERNLPMFASMIRQRVAFARGNDSEALISGLEKIGDALKLRMEPFE